MCFFIFNKTYTQFPPNGPIISGPLSAFSFCQNSGFEEGNFNNWQTFTGTLSSGGGVNLQGLTQNFNPTLHNIVNSWTTDPFGGFQIANCGNKAAKIGDLKGGRDISLIKYTFTVSQFNVNFSFRYAMVLEDPNHATSQQPFFQYMLLTGDRYYFTNTNQIVTSKKFTADRNNPFFNYVGNGIVSKDWSTECVNLSAYMGQQISIIFFVADCNPGAHGAYAYIDCLCKDNNAIASMTINDTEYCQNDEILLDGTASVNEDSYFLAIAETDQFGNVILGTEKSQWYVAQQAGLINFTNTLNQWNYHLKCNTYYKIKLAVSNGCTNWSETSKFIFIRCPDGVDFGQDIVMCCNNTYPVTIEDGDYLNHPTYTYNWTSNPYWSFMANNPNLPSYNYTPFVSSTFNVTVTDDYGCTLEDEINILIEQNFDVEITVEKLGCCSYNLVPSITFNSDCDLSEEDPKWLAIKYNSLNYAWSDGYTGKEHQVSPAQNTTYTLTVSNSCFTKTVSVYVPSNLTGNFPTIIAPNAMIPSSIIPANRKLIIREFGPNSPPDGQPAYNAKEYLLEIYDRWGHRIRTITGGGCNVLQGEIQWDGNSDFGKPLPTGVYIWKLYFKNCTHSSWQPVCHTYSNTNTQGWCAKYCIKWNPFPKNVCCKQWNDPCAYRITLLR